MSLSNTFAVLTADMEFAESCHRAAERAHLLVILASDCSKAAVLLGSAPSLLGAFLIDVDTVPYASAWLSTLEESEAELRVIGVSRYHPRFCQEIPPQCPAKHWLRKPVGDEEILAALARENEAEVEKHDTEALMRRGRL